MVEYGITVPHDRYDVDTVRKFHEVGAHQTTNTPAEVRKLVVPAGSCNSLCSVLLGLSKNPHNIEQVLTIGIGPDKMDWLTERMALIGVDVNNLPFKWAHFSLHDSGYSKYSDHFNGESFDGIDFHPTYEAKMWRWLREKHPITPDDQTGFWIVGSAPALSVVEPFYTEQV